MFLIEYFNNTSNLIIYKVIVRLCIFSLSYVKMLINSKIKFRFITYTSIFILKIIFIY